MLNQRYLREFLRVVPSRRHSGNIFQCHYFVTRSRYLGRYLESGRRIDKKKNFLLGLKRGFYLGKDLLVDPTFTRISSPVFPVYETLAPFMKFFREFFNFSRNENAIQFKTVSSSQTSIATLQPSSYLSGRVFSLVEQTS